MAAKLGQTANSTSTRRAPGTPTEEKKTRTKTPTPQPLKRSTTSLSNRQITITKPSAALVGSASPVPITKKGGSPSPHSPSPEMKQSTPSPTHPPLRNGSVSGPKTKASHSYARPTSASIQRSATVRSMRSNPSDDSPPPSAIIQKKTPKRTPVSGLWDVDLDTTALPPPIALPDSTALPQQQPLQIDSSISQLWRKVTDMTEPSPPLSTSNSLLPELTQRLAALDSSSRSPTPAFVHAATPLPQTVQKKADSVSSGSSSNQSGSPASHSSVYMTPEMATWVGRSPLPISDTVLGTTSPEALKMMIQTLRGEEETPRTSSASQQTSHSAIQIQEEPEPKPARQFLLGKTLNANALNSLFADRKPEQNVSNQKFTLLGTNFPLEPIYASKDDLAQFAFSDEEVQTVTRLDLSLTTVSDDQLEALLDRFPSIESISLYLNVNLTNKAIDQICKLKKLTSLEIRFCPKIDAKGIEALKNLCFDHLSEFALSTRVELNPSDFFQQLAVAPHLSRIDFFMCSNLKPEALLSLSLIRDLEEILINLKGCDEITEETISQLNGGRDHPFSIVTGEVDREDRSQLFSLLLPPPELPQNQPVLSMRKIQEHFSGSVVPDPTSLETAFTLGLLKPFKGLDWSGNFPDHSLHVFLKYCPEATWIRLHDCLQISGDGLLPLRHLLKINKLYFGNLPTISMKHLERLFVSPNDVNSWQHLQSVCLAGLPVSDKIVQQLARLPELKEVDLSFCDKVTCQAIRFFLKSPSIEKITLIGCRMDPFAIEEFRMSKPHVQLQFKYEPNSYLTQLALKEADREFHSGKPLIFRYIQETPIPQNDLDPKVLDEKEISKSYLRRLRPLGVGLKELGLKRLTPDFWIKADLVLQSFKNLIRVTDTLVSHLIDVGFFTDQDPEVVPKTTEELIFYLDLSVEIKPHYSLEIMFEKTKLKEPEKPPSELPRPQSVEKLEKGSLEVEKFEKTELKEPEKTPSELPKPQSVEELEKGSPEFEKPEIIVDQFQKRYLRKVQSFDFANLGLTFLPEFILLRNWEQLRVIDLEGNFIEEVPEKFIAQCPQLVEIRYSSKNRRVLKPDQLTPRPKTFLGLTWPRTRK